MPIAAGTTELVVAVVWRVLLRGGRQEGETARARRLVAANARVGQEKVG